MRGFYFLNPQFLCVHPQTFEMTNLLSRKVIFELHIVEVYCNFQNKSSKQIQNMIFETKF